ncbi:MAG: hypothetical protein ACRDFB_09910 [Rhabdochlamydiaceae bacterium]
MGNNSIIIGWGTIGKAIGNAFGITNYYSRTEHNVAFKDIGKFRYIHICLPTPTINGECYVDGITDTIKKILENTPGNEQRVFIIHSTVYPGYNRSLQKQFRIKNIVSNPEFLSEDTALENANHPALIVIGADDPKYREMVLGIYKGRFKYCEPIITDSVTAELLKLTLNAFFTTKVVFANEIFDYANQIKANYETIKLALENHPWGSKNHFTIHHKGGRGAGGKCLSKDIEALANKSDNELLQLIDFTNKLLLTESKKK